MQCVQPTIQEIQKGCAGAHHLRTRAAPAQPHPQPVCILNSELIHNGIPAILLEVAPAASCYSLSLITARGSGRSSFLGAAAAGRSSACCAAGTRAWPSQRTSLGYEKGWHSSNML
jgi:hypothetical protein